MKLFNVFAAFLFIGMLNNAEAQKKSIAGVEFPTIMKVNKKVVTLNGGGLREKYTIDLYVVGLYLRNPSMNAKKIMAAKICSAFCNYGRCSRKQHKTFQKLFTSRARQGALYK